MANRAHIYDIYFKSFEHMLAVLTENVRSTPYTIGVYSMYNFVRYAVLLCHTQTSKIIHTTQL